MSISNQSRKVQEGVRQLMSSPVTMSSDHSSPNRLLSPSNHLNFSSFPNSYSVCQSNSNPKAIDSLCEVSQSVINSGVCPTPFPHLTTVSKNLIRCLQINLRHSRAASAKAAQLALDLNIDVLFLHEPNAFSAPIPVLADVPLGFSAYHALSIDHANGTSILVRDSFAGPSAVTARHVGNHAACVDIKSSKRTFRFSSIYLRPSLVNFSATAEECFNLCASNNSVLLWF